MLADIDDIAAYQLTLGTYLLLLAFAFIVLAFVVEIVTLYRDVVSAPVSAAADERWWPEPDRRILLHLALGGGTVFAAIIAGYSLDPRQTGWLLTRPLHHHHETLLLAGVLFCLVALLSGVKPRQPVLLFCLTLPGLVILPMLWLWEALQSNHVADAVLWRIFFFFFQPGALILLFIAVGQSRLLRKPGGDLDSGGFVRLVLISFAYNYGLI